MQKAHKACQGSDILLAGSPHSECTTAHWPRNALINYQSFVLLDQREKGQILRLKGRFFPPPEPDFFRFSVSRFQLPDNQQIPMLCVFRNRSVCLKVSAGINRYVNIIIINMYHHWFEAGCKAIF